MAIFSKENCLYKYERYKRQRKRIRKPHRLNHHINTLEILENQKKFATYLINLLHTSHTSLHIRRGM